MESVCILRLCGEVRFTSACRDSAKWESYSKWCPFFFTRLIRGRPELDVFYQLFVKSWASSCWASAGEAFICCLLPPARVIPALRHSRNAIRIPLTEDKLETRRHALCRHAASGVQLARTFSRENSNSVITSGKVSCCCRVRSAGK